VSVLNVKTARRIVRRPSERTRAQTMTDETPKPVEQEAKAQLRPRAKRGPVLPNGLTAKQEAFAVAVANGSTLSDAYRRHYNIGKDTLDESIWVQAHNLYVNDKVQSRVKQILDQRAMDTRHDPARIAAWSKDLLAKIAADPNTTDSARIKAIEVLDRLAGLFTDKQELSITDNKEAESIRLELEAKLKALLQPPKLVG
jgi:hypothetical protein